MKVVKMPSKNKAPNVRHPKKALSEAALAERMALIPRADPRDLTGKWMGDPIPGDKRRPWLCKNTAPANSAESMS